PANIIAQTLNYYDGAPFTGRPFGQVGPYGALVRSESLVLTEDILHQGYRSADAVLTPPEEPPYLNPTGTPAWTAEYPPEFRSLRPAPQRADPTRPGLTITPAGYGFADGTGEHIRGYYVAAARQRYGFHDGSTGLGRGLVRTERNALGRDTTIAYDAYDLLPV